MEFFYLSPAKTQFDQPFDSLCMLWLSFDSNVVLQFGDFNTVIMLLYTSVCILPL